MIANVRYNNNPTGKQEIYGYILDKPIKIWYIRSIIRKGEIR